MNNKLYSVLLVVAIIVIALIGASVLVDNFGSGRPNFAPWSPEDVSVFYVDEGVWCVTDQRVQGPVTQCFIP